MPTLQVHLKCANAHDCLGLMDPRGMGVTHDALFSLLTQKQQLLSLTFCDTISGNEANFRKHGQMDEQTKVRTI